jgi:putative DNA-invertase from lambdoid prophage Rac
MPKVYGYIRCSTDDQADSGLGLEAGRDAVDQEFGYRWKREGFEFARTYEDRAVSGKHPLASRKGGSALNLALEAGDVVLFPRLDRGFRNTVDLLQTLAAWKARGVRAVFLNFGGLDTGTPMGEMVITLMGAFAQFERSQISDRTKAALDAARRRGKRLGHPPWGVKMVGPKGQRKPQFIPEDLVVARHVIRWRLEGLSWEAMYYHLREKGVTRRRRRGDPLRPFGGKEWTVTSIRRAYTGGLRLLRWIEEGKVQAPKEASS